MAAMQTTPARAGHFSYFNKSVPPPAYLSVFSSPKNTANPLAFVVLTEGAEMTPSVYMRLAGYVKTKRLRHPRFGIWLKIIGKLSNKFILAQWGLRVFLESCQKTLLPTVMLKIHVLINFLNIPVSFTRYG